MTPEVLAQFKAATIPLVAKAFLADISSGEANAFNELADGGTFNSYTWFPAWAGIWHGDPSEHSHGAGLFQFEPGTWATAAKGAGVTDFSPQSQILAAWWLAQDCWPGLLQQLESGHLQNPRPRVFLAQWGRSEIAGPPGATYQQFLTALSAGTPPTPSPTAPSKPEPIDDPIHQLISASDFEQAVRDFQTAHGLTPDGVIGKLTLGSGSV